jgi:carbonic anhydrase
MGSWGKSLDTLIAGNERFVNDECNACRSFEEQRRILLEQGQEPLAIIVSTADAYMPPELVFDADLGDLFVLRLPELDIDRGVMDAIEYAALKLKIPLCMILAHDAREGDPEPAEGFWERFKREDEDEEFEVVKSCVKRLRNHSDFEELMELGEFFVVGAKYDMESGRVTVFDF